jgi:ElaB/YqjD/DUF883 family membrane-anchored ribosome-binding protein
MPANSSLNNALDQARAAGEEARSQFEATLSDLARRAERAVHEGFDAVKSRAGSYSEGAGQQLDTAQRYVTSQVQERPLTTTLAALGVGVVVGFLLSGGRRD